MDKVLAFSILSASPADISAGAAGVGGSWARLSWRRGANADQQQQQQKQQQREEDKEKRGSRSRDGREHARGGRAAAPAAPRFAPEFDGIDCFETIVSH